MGGDFKKRSRPESKQKRKDENCATKGNVQEPLKGFVTVKFLDTLENWHTC